MKKGSTTNSSTVCSSASANNNRGPAALFSSRRTKASSSFKKKNATELAVGPFLRRGSCAGVAVWVLGLLLVYCLCPSDSFQYLPTTEWNANMAVLVVLLSTNVSRFLHLVIRDKSLIFVNSGIMVGSMTVQLLAIASITLMISLPTPVMVDPVTGLRTHMVRWVEWVVLSFLMTFLTESIDMRGARLPWMHGLAIGLSTVAGAIFPFCPNWNCWLAVFAISWLLFMSIFVRLYQRYQRFSHMQRPTESNSLDETQRLDYERAKYSLRTIAICAFSWTLLAMSFSSIAISRKFVPQEHFLASESLILLVESFFEIVSKVWYFNVLVEVHNIIFDDASQAMQRFEEIRVVMSTIWNTSSDVMIWCTMDRENHSIHAVVSPSFVEWQNPTPSRGDDDDDVDGKGEGVPKSLRSKHPQDGQKKPTLILEIDSKRRTFSHHILQLKLDSAITREDAVDLMKGMEESQILETSDGENHNETQQKKDEIVDGNITTLASLLSRIFESPASEFVIMEDNFKEMILQTRVQSEDDDNIDDEVDTSSNTIQRNQLKRDIGFRQLHCEAKISKVDDSSCLVVVRDISERHERFEMEKQLVAEITARKKDTEANRFTRHEVKNSILACIGVLESMRGPTKEHQLPTQPTIIEQDEDCDHPILPTRNIAHPTSDSVSSATSSGLMDYLSFEEHAGELDSTLRTVLDTIMDHAMSREVIYEEYEVRKERILVPDLLWNIRRSATSSMGSRFTLTAYPKDFPILGLDPRLLRYIYQNALSNACRYGERGGLVETVIHYKESTNEFRLEVINLPGSDHQDLLELTHSEVQKRVFSPGTQLHHKRSEERDMTISNSSGDGAWIMSKCARMLRGGCELRFQPDRTIFSFWCPAKTHASQEIKEPQLLALPEGTWGVAIDDSGIQRKLVSRYLKIAGIEQARRIVVGGTAEEIYGFSDMVVELVMSHPESKFLIIADENLDVLEGSVMHGSVSGSLCLQKILERLDGEHSTRVLALVRSANDSAKDTDLYKSRAHGYLVKAPIDKDGVLKAIQPWWFRRFSATVPEDSKCSIGSISESKEMDDYDPFVDIKAALEVLNALSMTAFSSLIKRWRSIQDRLHALKGDLKSTIPRGCPELRFIIQRIDTLRSGGCPDSLRSDWLLLHRDIVELLERERANYL